MRWFSFNEYSFDNLVLFVGKVEDADKVYPFSTLDPHTYTDPIVLPTFTSQEYRQFPSDPNNEWSEDATRHVFELVSKFDTRFEIMQYFWDAERFGKKDCVDLRAKFTEIYNLLLKIRGLKTPPLPPYDAASERKRRVQLNRLQMRTQEEVRWRGHLDFVDDNDILYDVLFRLMKTVY